jgi:beta-1,4-mannosyl-glycoprotein beta-1,4-N-acetylglucosaminyltransferase
VDYFIVVEANHTFSGKPKALCVSQAILDEYKSKIIYIQVNDMPNNSNAWDNETHQRCACERGIKQLRLNDNDVIISSDIDEIVDPEILNKIKNNDIVVNNIYCLEQDLYYYNLNSKVNHQWHSSRVFSYKWYVDNNISFEDIRRHLNYTKIPKGGWHLSYFGTSTFIKEKLEAFSHQEYNKKEYTNSTYIDDHISRTVDLFNRNIHIIKVNIDNNNYLPVHYDKYLQAYYE